MLNSKTLWFILKTIVTGVWCVLVLFAFLIPSQIMDHCRIMILILLLIHLFELPISLKIGTENGISKSVTVVKTICYGFTWWIPLRRGVISE